MKDSTEASMRKSRVAMVDRVGTDDQTEVETRSCSSFDDEKGISNLTRLDDQ